MSPVSTALAAIASDHWAGISTVQVPRSTGASCAIRGSPPVFCPHAEATNSGIANKNALVSTPLNAPAPGQLGTPPCCGSGPNVKWRAVNSVGVTRT